ncbi:MAG TPA: hypothetical protein VFV92_07490 [Candidatus Bathyarchaeia archaeon]|nr:hypothetical protein [Candidatus Bathyarchaeia archaeon]
MRLPRKQSTNGLNEFGLEQALIWKLGIPFHFCAILVQIIVIFAKSVQAHFNP